MVDRRDGREAHGMTGSVKQLVLPWAMEFVLLAVAKVMSADEPKPQPTFAEFLVALERGDVHIDGAGESTRAPQWPTRRNAVA
jgi:hypothetical protein